MLAVSPSLERLEGRVCSLTLPVRKWCLRLPALLGGCTWNIYQFYSESGWTENNAKFQDRNMPLKITLCSRNCNYLLVSNSQSYGFSSSHVQMWELNPKEGWALKDWCFWTVVLEKILESSLNSKQIKPVNPKGNQPWIFIRRTDAEAEAPIFWPPDAKSRLIGKDPDAGKDRGQEEKRMSDRGWDGWMASPTQWTWVWANSRS